MSEPRDARREATLRLGAGREARALEPSPPAVDDGVHFADDPTDPSGADQAVVTPVSSAVPPGGTTWDLAVAVDPGLAAFAGVRWLVSDRSLPDLPADLSSTRDGLQRLALHVIYRMRRRVNGKYAVRRTLGGFGTPFYGDDEQVRVEGDTIVHQRAGEAASAPITSLRAAGEFLGIEVDPDFDHGFHDVVPAGDLDADLAVDAASAHAIGEWLGFATSVFEEIRAERVASGPSRIQLWPEHFDAAFDLAYDDPDPRDPDPRDPDPGDPDPRDPAAGRRVNIGASSGDGGHEDPYLYVGPWTSDRPGGPGYWNVGFGAILGHGDILAVGDGRAQRARALAFVREGLGRLAGQGKEADAKMRGKA